MKKHKNLKQVEVYVLEAILNKCQTISQIVNYVNNLKNKSINDFWKRKTFDSVVKDLVDREIILRIPLDEFLCAKGYFYSINPKKKQNIDTLIKCFKKYFEK